MSRRIKLKPLSAGLTRMIAQALPVDKPEEEFKSTLAEISAIVDAANDIDKRRYGIHAAYHYGKQWREEFDKQKQAHK